jgi:TPR repeat protein
VWWFVQAAKQNHPGAQFMIGVASHLGIGIEANRFHSARMLMLSAARGNQMAKAYLPTVFAELTPEERLLLDQWIAESTRKN